MDVGIALWTADELVEGRPPSWPEIATLAALVEDLGFASLWFPDHLLWKLPVGPRGFLEHATVLGAVAATTDEITIGSAVMCSSFRSPGIAAKIADTTQEVSGGRYVLGLGAGGPRGEYEAFGYPTDHLGSRFAEYVEIVASLLRDRTASFEGRFHSVSDAVMTPTPESGPSPILVAARGLRTIETAARFADEWNWYTIDDVRAGYFAPFIEMLDEACERFGRDPADVRRSVDVMVAVEPAAGLVEGAESLGMSPLVGDLDHVAGVLDEIGGLGVEEVHLYPLPGSGAAEIEALAPLIDRLA
ncbi:MAG TPA: LLM class flavin-dependent oxidoreductase [Acidimicrobiia bacterium]|nr:LLM class flavin-dependent oxidoreductase [Acidimicrobiia bacterium]